MTWSQSEECWKQHETVFGDIRGLGKDKGTAPL